jgi:hypothetical protein
MKRCFLPLVCLALATSALGAKKVVSPKTSAGNEQVDIVATIYLTADEITQKLGEDPGPGIALLEVRFIPKTDDAVQVSPDDFILLAHDDGERAKPFDPAQIAGQGAMVETNTPEKGKKTSVMGSFGGFGGGSGASPGNSKAPNIKTKMDDRSEGNKNLLKALRAKQFPQKDSKEPVEGLLYFPLDGKHKLKNLAVLYRGSAGRLNLEFEH